MTRTNEPSTHAFGGSTRAAPAARQASWPRRGPRGFEAAGAATKGHAIRVIELAVHDELFTRFALRPGATLVTSNGLTLRYRTRMDVERSRSSVDGWICPPRVTAPGRTAVALTLAGEFLEQGPSGELVQDGSVCEVGRILAIGQTGGAIEGPLSVGRGAAFLIGESSGAMWQLRIALSSILVWIFDQPRLPRDVPRVEGWLERAGAMAASRTGPSRGL